MIKEAIFTICAKNYLAQAKTLGYSVKKYCPNTDFFILLSDEINDDNILCEDFNIIESKSIGIKDFNLMAYKYDVVEFSTAIKPYFIDNLLNAYGYSKVLYIDPDIVVYNSLTFLFEKLDNYAALITPHLIKPYIHYEGATSEEELLFVGIYNLGFFGVNNSSTGKHIINWWKERLKDQCYADKFDALHVDQRWMDFLPALYGNEIEILKHPGMNVAFWNLHERDLRNRNEHYTVDNEPLVLFHFSGLDVRNYTNISKKQNKYHFDKNPELRNLFENYVTDLKANGYEYFHTLKYYYNMYDNGVQILRYQRRIFRADNQLINNFINPFSTSSGSFYMLLVKHKLMIFDKIGKYQSLKKGGVENINKKIEVLKKAMLILKKIIGIKYYYLLMKFLNEFSRFEEQLFLIGKSNKNENRN